MFKIIFFQTSGAVPQKLQIITLKSITNEECNDEYNGQGVDVGHICTYNKIGEGACNVSSLLLISIFQTNKMRIIVLYRATVVVRWFGIIRLLEL